MKLPDFDFDARLFPAPPMWLVAVVTIGAFIPATALSAIWYKRNKNTAAPRYHIFQDMDASVAVKAQEASAVFADGRGARPYAPGTVAWGRHIQQPDPDMLKDDDLSYRGFAIHPETGEPVRVGGGGSLQFDYLDGMPAVVASVNLGFMERGRQQYNTFCMPCHGLDGQGGGPVHARADLLATQKDNPTATTWTAPADLTAPKFGEDQYPTGQLFDTITNGAGNMAGYGSQIDVVDRWAIVAYVRAIQGTDRSEAPQ